MKRLLPILIVILLIVLAFFSPWRNLGSFITNMLGINQTEQASLIINSKVGEFTVYINDKEVGDTPYEQNNIKPDKYSIRLEKITDEPEFYSEFNRTIEIERNTQVVIDWELGPSEEFSKGEIYFFKEKLSDDNTSSVSIICTPEDSQVNFDGVEQSGSPITIENVKEDEHKMKITKDGYIEEEVEVLTKAGYDLFVEIQLFPLPINID